MKHIPNLFTLLNLIFGCCAIVVVLQNGIMIQYTAEGSQLIDVPERIWLASLCIVLAALVDFADGFVARLFNVQSEIGKQLDSLADVVSFGVAPSMIVYQFLRMSFAQDENGMNVSLWFLVPSFCIAAAAAYRLAVFNLDSEQQYGFKGVPTPAVGLLLASVPVIYWHAASPVVLTVLLNKWFWYGMILLLVYLMNCRIPMLSLKISSYSVKENAPKIILLVFSVLCVLLMQWLAVPVIFIGYILLSLLFKNK